jgi:SAM-dependent methyltransferase
MTERQFSEHRLAALYDRFYPPEKRADFAFYLPLVMAARSVLDVGCGTGALLRMAREAGHAGRLVGLDPAGGMLAQARQRSDVKWMLGELSTVRWERKFDLIVMTGHAFQQLIGDDEIRVALAAAREALTDDGRFAFETRNPADRAWERWPERYSGELIDTDGSVVRCEYRVEQPLTGGVVHSVSTYSSPAWEQPEVSRGALRFVDAETLSAFLVGAGLVIERQFGNWDRSPFGADSPEIITIARRARPLP